MYKVGATAKQVLLVVLGLLSLAIGIVGIWVPGLPTTIFILFALWAFSRSSQRLQRMICRIPWLQSAVTEAELFAKHRQVSRRAKIVSQSCAWLMAALTIALTQNHLLWAIVAAAALSCSLFMWWIPTYTASDQSQIQDDLIEAEPSPQSAVRPPSI